MLISICDDGLHCAQRIFRYKRSLIIIYCVSWCVAEEMESPLFSHIRATSFYFPLEGDTGPPREEIVGVEALSCSSPAYSVRERDTRARVEPIVRS